MKFTEAIDKDLEIFVSLDEFAEIHEINGYEMNSVFQESTSAKSGNASRNFDGLHGNFQSLYFKRCDMEKIPQEGESIRVDNRRFTVESSEDQKGIVKLELSSYRGRGL